MSYRDDDDYWFDPDAADRAADAYFSHLYDSPDERQAKASPSRYVVECTQDEYDAWRERKADIYYRSDFDSQDRYYL